MLGKSLGYEYVSSLYSRRKLHSVLSEVFSENHIKSSLIEVRVKKGFRKDLGRPTTTPKKNKEDLIKFIRENDYE